MKACLCTLAVLFALANCVSAEEFSPAAQAELARLAGEWRLVSYISDGKETLPRIEDICLFERDRFGRKGLPLVRISHLNPEAQVKEIDLELADGTVVRQIYELKDNQLRICSTFRYCGFGAKAADRPTDFETKGTKRQVMIYERVAK
jgi:uncharacterized protein (TIGR03067 family)